MSKPDIFISYCRQDRPAARLFAESFAEEGFKVWWDAVMHSGETFDEVIERELRASKAVVVLWSPRSVASRWVRAEATQADRANKLVPVKIEACELPFIFELTHTADLSEWQGDRSDSNWRSLVSDLRRHVEPAKDGVTAQESAAEPRAEPVTPAAAKATEQATPPSTRPDKDAGAADEDAASQEDLARTLERLAISQGSALLEPTPTEEAQANFFKRSDEYRQDEGENLHCLRRLHAPEGDAVHVVGPNGLSIGRTAPSDVIVFEPGVSREHCLVELAADKVRVMDLNSTNGTYIDNRRIGRAEILPVGSVLRVGNISFEHEVHPRTEMPLSGDLIDFDREAGGHRSRSARS